MPNVTRFPHYHQAENVVTNHVMVMLRMLYDFSPNLLEALLKALCAEEITVGPLFSQQIAGNHSVPDGLILQEPLAVFIETKLGRTVDADQLERHCRTIVERLPGRKGNILISLTSGEVGQQPVPGDVSEMARQRNITVVPVTFAELVTQIAQLEGLDLALRATVQEFTDFISAQGLLPRRDQILLAVLTGISWRENHRFGVYYEPSDRSPKWQRAAFLGLYHDKQVSHIGRIVAAVCAMENNAGDIRFDDPEMGELNDARREAVREIINSAEAYYPHLQKDHHRYYLVDGFADTNFMKVSSGGMMGHRYFDIEEISERRLDTNASGDDAARRLNGRTFI